MIPFIGIKQKSYKPDTTAKCIGFFYFIYMSIIKPYDFTMADVVNALHYTTIPNQLEEYFEIGFEKSRDYHGLKCNCFPLEWDIHINEYHYSCCNMFIGKNRDGFELYFNSRFFCLVEDVINKNEGIDPSIISLMIRKIPFYLEQERDKEEDKKTEPTTNLYLVHDTESKKLKIGISKKPQSRLSQLQTANPSELKMLYCIQDASYQLEKELHSLFDKYHVRREWFEYNHEIINHFKKLSQDEK